MPGHYKGQEALKKRVSKAGKTASAKAMKAKTLALLAKKKTR